jgi:hypothetical protein
VTQSYVEYSKAITRRYVAYSEVLLDTKFEKLRTMLQFLCLHTVYKNVTFVCCPPQASHWKVHTSAEEGHAGEQIAI